MTDQQILEKAIQKAIDGGWDIDWIGRTAFRIWHLLDTPYHQDYTFAQPQAFIFNHDFAKALWANEGDGNLGQMALWKYHLANMVIADDPIQYLGDNI